MSIERIIGIDFGTSTSLVKVKNYKDGQPVDGDPTSSQYVEFDGRDMVPTLIRFAETAEYYGYEAKQNYPGSTLCKNFKLNLQSPDTKAKAEAQELTKKFFRFLHKQYADQSGHFGQCDMERTLVSYPAKWTKETRDFMVRTAKDAGFKNVAGMDEPTAALYTVMVQESDRLVKQGYLTAGKPAYVLMIDMGAGTTDLALCKYTPGGQNRIIDTWPPVKSGVLFGGREMDELLLKYVLDYLGKCGISEKMRANVEKQKLEDCKSWKEDSVSATLRNRQKVPYCTFVQDLMMMVDDDTPFPAIDRAVLESYCKNYISRYAELILGAMSHAQTIDPAFQGGADLSLAVLTGGHSQWYFARDMLCGALPGYEDCAGVRLAEDQVVSLTRPQGTVSSGMVFSVQALNIKSGSAEAAASDRSGSANMGDIYDEELGRREQAVQQPKQEYIPPDGTPVPPFYAAINVVTGKAVSDVLSGEGDFTVELKSAGANVIAVVKAVKEINRLELGDAKRIVDSAPCVIKSGVTKLAAETIKNRLAGLGATVEIVHDHSQASAVTQTTTQRSALVSESTAHIDKSTKSEKELLYAAPALTAYSKGQCKSLLRDNDWDLSQILKQLYSEMVEESDEAFIERCEKARSGRRGVRGYVRTEDDRFFRNYMQLQPNEKYMTWVDDSMIGDYKNCIILTNQRIIHIQKMGGYSTYECAYQNAPIAIEHCQVGDNLVFISSAKYASRIELSHILEIPLRLSFAPYLRWRRQNGLYPYSFPLDTTHAFL